MLPSISFQKAGHTLTLTLSLSLSLPLLLLSPVTHAQTFRRFGTCPDLGCIIPPDQQDFLPGQEFDIRLEVHAPLNGSEAFNGGVPDTHFTATIVKEGGGKKGGKRPPPRQSIGDFFFGKEAAAAAAAVEPALETWTFSWFEDLFAEDAGTPSVVKVASRAYRRVALYEPGEYTVTLRYYGGRTTTARWTVRPLATRKRAKNVIFFIGE